MLLYILLVLLVYLAPLMFTCPCIMDRHHLAARPAVIGRRGAPMVGGASVVWIDKLDQDQRAAPPSKLCKSAFHVSHNESLKTLLRPPK